MHSDEILWWAKGGVLHGESWKGMGFLREIIEDAPAEGLTPIYDVEDNELFIHSSTQWYWTRISGGMADGYYLIYLGEHQMTMMPVWSEDDQYDVDVIDTREMTITPTPMQPVSKDFLEQISFRELAQVTEPTYCIELPSKPYLAVRIRRR